MRRDLRPSRLAELLRAASVPVFGAGGDQTRMILSSPAVTIAFPFRVHASVRRRAFPAASAMTCALLEIPETERPVRSIDGGLRRIRRKAQQLDARWRSRRECVLRGLPVPASSTWSAPDLSVQTICFPSAGQDGQQRRGRAVAFFRGDHWRFLLPPDFHLAETSRGEPRAVRAERQRLHEGPMRHTVLGQRDVGVTIFRRVARS